MPGFGADSIKNIYAVECYFAPINSKTQQWKLSLSIWQTQQQQTAKLKKKLFRAQFEVSNPDNVPQSELRLFAVVCVFVSALNAQSVSKRSCEKIKIPDCL